MKLREHKARFDRHLLKDAWGHPELDVNDGIRRLRLAPTRSLRGLILSIMD